MRPLICLNVSVCVCIVCIVCMYMYCMYVYVFHKLVLGYIHVHIHTHTDIHTHTYNMQYFCMCLYCLGHLYKIHTYIQHPFFHTFTFKHAGFLMAYECWESFGRTLPSERDVCGASGGRSHPALPFRLKFCLVDSPTGPG